MQIKAIYERTIYHNPDNRFCIIGVKTANPDIPEKARSKYTYRDGLNHFTAVGYGLPQSDKVELVLEGEWENSKHGLQLKVAYFRENVPPTIDGIKGYLGSGLVKGIGPATANLVVERFGISALDILESQPERYLEIPGITDSKLSEIKESYASSRILSDLMALLGPADITPNAAAKIHKEFGAESIAVIRNRPFELCRISGFGFIKVDDIARKTGCRPNDPMRIRGALFYTLDQSRVKDGHLYLEQERLCKRALKLLNDKLPDPMKVQLQEVKDALYNTILEGKLVASGEAVYLRRSFSDEDAAAQHIVRLLARSVKVRDISHELAEVKQALGISLSAKQEAGVMVAFKSNLSIITGSPGTGKTTVLKTVIEVFKKLMPNGKISLAAPTGRASRRMAESTGFSDAKTLHKALGLLGGEENSFMNSDDPLDADLLIIDEFSMVDMWLGAELFSRLQKGTKVLLVGDADQLPSVGAGNVFKELIDCGMIPVTVLDEIFRQSKDSLIAYNARFINQGRTGLVYGNDFILDKCQTTEQAAARIQEIYLEEIARDGIEDVQILSPMNESGDASADKLNAAIRERFNPSSPNTPELTVGSRIFRLGDKVMQTKNKGEVSNGDVGFVRKIYNGIVMIDFGDNRIVEYDHTGLNTIELAFAMTVHKAMGSEYNTVIVPVLSAHTILLYRNLLYTAITRAKHRVILVGQLGTLITTIHKNKDGKRNTMLAHRIRQYAIALTQKSEAA